MTILRIPGLLEGQVLDVVRNELSSAQFVDGRLTADPRTAANKHNLQVKGGDVARRVGEAIRERLRAHPVVVQAVRPAVIEMPIIARYEPGMSYGWHVDSPIGRGRLGDLRRDVSMTLFLSSLADYDGGELIVDTLAGPQSIRAEAGDAVLYPSTSLHRVAPVTRGIRLVAVLWLQSAVRSAEHRQVLFDLERSCEYLSDRLRAGEFSDDDQRCLLDLRMTHANLVRMWTGT